MTGILIDPYSLVDLMNALLVLICAFFVIAIIATLRDKKLYKLLASINFLSTNNIIHSWSWICIAILFYALTELGFVLGIIQSIRLYKLLKTIFAIILAIGLFLRYTTILRYIRKIHNR